MMAEIVGIKSKEENASAEEEKFLVKRQVIC